MIAPIGIILSLTLHAQSDSTRAIRLLKMWEQKTASIQTMTYHSVFTNIYPAVDDSIYTAESTIWLAAKPTDTIFGCIFHVSGTGRRGRYDYYYDGQKSVEILHWSKQILVIDPHLFPNDEHNPAKARMTLNAVQPLLYRKDLIRYLVTANPYAPPPRVSLDAAPDTRDNPTAATAGANKRGGHAGGAWRLLLQYPPNKVNSVTTDTLYLRKQDNILIHSGRENHFNGTTMRTIYDIDHLIVNQTSIADSITLTSSFPGYHLTEQKPTVATPDTLRTYFTGKPAPAFDLPLLARGDASTANSSSTANNTRPADHASLADFNGKYLLLDFWETWCGYCILAMPELKTLYQKYHPKGLEILGITTENEAQVKQLVLANALPYLHARGNTTLLQTYHITARPTYILIDPTGHIAACNDWPAIKIILEKL